MRKQMLVPFVSLALPLAAQFSGPSLGLVYDAPNQALRRISGMPGGAMISDPVLTGIASAAIAPDHTYAIVSDGEYKLYTAAGLRPLPMGLPNSSRIAFSATGESAAFYADGTFTLVTGLPTVPQLQTIASQGVVKQFAVNGAGLLLVSVSQQQGEALFSMRAQGAPIHLLDVTQAGAIIFSKDGSKAWISDVLENRVWAVASLDTSPSIVPVAAASDGLDAPIALALSADGQRLFIANRGNASVITFDLTRNSALSITPCACQPATLAPLAASSVFALTGLSQGPMWIFDSSQPDAQTMFIPAVMQ